MKKYLAIILLIVLLIIPISVFAETSEESKFSFQGIDNSIFQPYQTITQFNNEATLLNTKNDLPFVFTIAGKTDNETLISSTSQSTVSIKDKNGNIKKSIILPMTDNNGQALLMRSILIGKNATEYTYKDNDDNCYIADTVKYIGNGQWRYTKRVNEVVGYHTLPNGKKRYNRHSK